VIRPFERPANDFDKQKRAIDVVIFFIPSFYCLSTDVSREGLVEFWKNLQEFHNLVVRMKRKAIFAVSRMDKLEDKVPDYSKLVEMSYSEFRSSQQWTQMKNNALQVLKLDGKPLNVQPLFNYGAADLADGIHRNVEDYSLGLIYAAVNAVRGGGTVSNDDRATPFTFTYWTQDVAFNFERMSTSQHYISPLKGPGGPGKPNRKPKPTLLDDEPEDEPHDSGQDDESD